MSGHSVVGVGRLDAGQQSGHHGQIARLGDHHDIISASPGWLLPISHHADTALSEPLESEPVGWDSAAIVDHSAAELVLSAPTPMVQTEAAA